MRLKVQITGLVQGVGFRPFVFRLAEEMGLSFVTQEILEESLEMLEKTTNEH